MQKQNKYKIKKSTNNNRYVKRKTRARNNEKIRTEQLKKPKKLEKTRTKKD